MGVERDYWFCSDCVDVVEQCESSLDYYYEEAKAHQRAREIERGLASLGGYPAMDVSEEDEVICAFCGFLGLAEDYPVQGDDAERICPKCLEDGLMDRAHGHDEFTWEDCDCCGSSLGGARTRYMILTEGE